MSDWNSRALRVLVASLVSMPVCDIAVASAARQSTVYVLQDAGKIGVYRGQHHWEIAGPDTQMKSVVDIKRQPLGDLVVSNREIDGKAGSIVTIPAGEGDVVAKHVIKCKGFTPWGIGVDANSNIWMTDYEANDVRAYPANAEGCPTPLALISGSHTGLDQPENVAVDRNGRIIVSNYLHGIVIFAAGSTGDTSPVATITNAQVMNAHLEGMTLDRKNNIWLTSYANQAVLEYGPDANGNAAPKRVISGPNTQLNAPVGIAVDRKTGEIYVADYGARTVLVFAADAKGNAAPARTMASGFDFGIAVH